VYPILNASFSSIMYNKRCSQHLPSYDVHRSSYQAPALGIAMSQTELGLQGLLQPPLEADPQLWQWFCTVDTDSSGTITVPELQSALMNGGMPSYLPTYKVLISESCFSGNWTSEVLSHFLVVFDLSSGQNLILTPWRCLCPHLYVVCLACTSSMHCLPSSISYDRTSIEMVPSAFQVRLKVANRNLEMWWSRNCRICRTMEVYFGLARYFPELWPRPEWFYWRTRIVGSTVQLWL